MTQPVRYLTVSQMISELDEVAVGRTAVRSWVRSGKVPRLRLPNGEYRIHPAVVEAIKIGADPWEVWADVRRAEETQAA